MKVHSPAPIENFTPVRLTITLESQQEVAEFHSLFNHGKTSAAVPNISGAQIRDVIDQQILNRKGYAEAFDHVCDMFRCRGE